MKIWVKAKTGAKEDRVTPPPLRLFESGPTTPAAPQDTYVVATRERPVEGRANEAITGLLAAHFGVPRQAVRLVSGRTAKRKVFDIEM